MVPTPRGQKLRSNIISARNLFCLVMIVMSFNCYGKRPNPRHTKYNHNTVSWRTEPADNSVFFFLGGIILKGTAINPATRAPSRHLWVDDATSGL